MPLKIYEAEARNVFADRDLLDALGEPAHRQQATIYIAATSKNAAAQVLNEAFNTSLYTGRVMALAMGNTVDALVAGGVLTTPGELIALPLSPHWGDPVVRYAEGAYRRVGRVERSETRAHGYTFIPEEN